MNLKSTFALLDVTTGRKKLDKMMPPGSQSLPDNERIPVVIHGWISHRHGSDRHCVANAPTNGAYIHISTAA